MCSPLVLGPGLHVKICTHYNRMYTCCLPNAGKIKPVSVVSGVKIPNYKKYY